MQEDCDFLKTKGIDIIKVIGISITGTVYYVYSTKYKSYLALRKSNIKYANPDEEMIVNSLNKDRVVNIMERFQEDDYIYTLMEYCPIDMARISSHKQKMTDEKLFSHIKSILLAVKNCHDNGIVHGKLKPSHFLIDNQGDIRLCNFELARVVDHHNQSINSNMGSVYFMAPEVIKNKPYDPFAADIWALGVTLFYIVTRTYPFYGDNKAVVQYSILHGIYNHKLITDILLRDLIAQCLEVHPLKRATINDLLLMPYFNQKSLQNSRFNRRHSMFIQEYQPPVTDPSRLGLTKSIFSVQSGLYKQTQFPKRICLYSTDSRSTETLAIN